MNSRININKPGVISVVVSILIATVFLSPQFASAALGTVWSQGFEADTAGWFGDADGFNGVTTQVVSGTDGITSATGDYHAIMTGDTSSAPFSRFDGYRAEWTGDWVAEVAVYLDPNWETGQGFDYSVASNGSDGNHQRDFIFHVGVVEDTGDIVGKALLVNGSNNANFFTDSSKLLNDNNGNYYQVANAGWYTLQHVFRDDAGVLAVDLNLLDSNGVVVWTATRINPQDTIPTEVGGNRYAWFTHIDVANGIAVDDHTLQVEVPFERSAEILSPESGEEVSGVVNFVANLVDEAGNDNVQWAVRAGSCSSGTVAGNVDGFTSPFSWDGASFTASVDMSTLATGGYCFTFNPTESSGDTPIRLTRNFVLVAEPEPPVAPDTQAPLVTIESPLAGAVVSGTVAVFGTIDEDVAMGNHNIALYTAGVDVNNFSLRLAQNNVSNSSIFTNQAIWSFDSTLFTDGDYQLRFAARDAAGNRDLSNPEDGGISSVHVIPITIQNDEPEEPEPPVVEDPTAKKQCMKGGWKDFDFKNQGQCVRFVETGKDTR